MTSKEEILRRIVSADVAPFQAQREPIKTSLRTRREILDQFADYAAEYKANVYRLTSEQVAAKVGELSSGGSWVVPEGIPIDWISNIQFVYDRGLSTAELNNCEGVLTGCALGVAETGTVVLDSGPTQGRRVMSLVPDHHICVVLANDVVDDLPEAIRILEEAMNERRPLTWISGPSATSDIELSRVEGVHGPRTLDILIVED